MEEKKTIKQLRKEKGLTGKFVAQKIGVDQPTYSVKENMKRKFSVKEMAMLCDLFGVGYKDIRDIDFY